ncbi:MAG: hypothetical protein WBC17_01510, partial [Mycobacterium sp.]
MNTDPDGREARLRAARDQLAEAMAEATPTTLPALAREYRITMAELDSLTTGEEESVVDQLAQRRSAK